jgi:hypothetical protein
LSEEGKYKNGETGREKKEEGTLGAACVRPSEKRAGPRAEWSQSGVEGEGEKMKKWKNVRKV